MSLALRRVTVWLALAAFLGGLGLPASFVLHRPDDTDAAWGAPGLVAGHPVTQIESVRPAEGDRHCAICHWLRALTHSVVAAPMRRPELAFVRLAYSSVLVDLQDAAQASSPARAPPASIN